MSAASDIQGTDFQVCRKIDHPRLHHDSALVVLPRHNRPVAGKYILSNTSTMSYLQKYATDDPVQRFNNDLLLPRNIQSVAPRNGDQLQLEGAGVDFGFDCVGEAMYSAFSVGAASTYTEYRLHINIGNELTDVGYKTGDSLRFHKGNLSIHFQKVKIVTRQWK